MSPPPPQMPPPPPRAKGAGHGAGAPRGAWGGLAMPTSWGGNPGLKGDPRAVSGRGGTCEQPAPLIQSRQFWGGTSGWQGRGQTPPSPSPCPFPTLMQKSRRATMQPSRARARRGHTGRGGLRWPPWTPPLRPASKGEPQQSPSLAQRRVQLGGGGVGGDGEGAGPPP